MCSFVHICGGMFVCPYCAPCYLCNDIFVWNEKQPEQIGKIGADVLSGHKLPNYSPGQRKVKSDNAIYMLIYQNDCILSYNNLKLFFFKSVSLRLLHP